MNIEHGLNIEHRIMMSLRSAIYISFGFKNLMSNLECLFLFLFIFSHSKFDVGRSMFDVNLLFCRPSKVSMRKNNPALMGI